MQLGSTPWHLWGQVVSVNVPAPQAGAPIDVFLNPQQVANVQYGRPDTWAFMLGLGIQAYGGGQVLANVTPRIDVLCGVGRSNYKLENFWRWEFDSAQINLGVPFFTWTTRAQVPNTQTHGLEAVTTNFVEWIPAQSIQVQLRSLVRFDSTVGGITITCLAHFAPLHHHRPEWHLADRNGRAAPKFSGELGGF